MVPGLVARARAGYGGRSMGAVQPTGRARWIAAMSIGAMVGCSRPNPAFDPVQKDTDSTSTTTGDGTTDPAASTSTSTSTTDVDPGDGPDTLGMDGTTSSGECVSPPARPSDYRACSLGCQGGVCLDEPAPGPVEYDLSVCTSACAEDCDCPLPANGTADPVCTRDGCVLDCSEGRSCPDGMLCEEQSELCFRADAYGPCGPGCPSGYCFLIQGVGNVCPAVTCLEGQLELDELCPPPANGDAVPVCFEPQSPPELQGEGWCVLDCFGGRMCPQGMFCENGSCFHPS